MQIIKGFKNILILLILLMAGLRGESQSIMKAFVYDQATKQPVPFATIKVLHQPFGTFTGEKGNFEVIAAPDDTLLISSIGYITKKVTGFPDSIFLGHIIKELPPVILSQKHAESTQTVGINAKADFQWGPSGYGEEFAQKIELNLIDHEYCHIKKITLSAKQFSAETPVLLHIYAADTVTGLPLNELLSKQYFISKEHFRKDRITVDISSEKLYVSDSIIFVSVEWLGYGRNERAVPKSSTRLNMTNKVPQIFTYARSLQFTSFHWFPAPLVNGKITNTIFQIEMDILK